jgi:UPF0042 nucleotide-binding protein
MPANARFVIITGLSGSGKSTALNALEDLGFYAVDNLPVALLPAFVQMPSAMMADIFKAAIVMDLRTPDFIEDFPRIYRELAARGHRLEILFLEAREEALVRRFSQTRRSHPLPGASIVQGLRREKELLAPTRELADQIVDTSRFNPHELRGEIGGLFARMAPPTGLQLNLLSFGFKYGLPNEADLVFDVRFLPNPYFVDELRNLNGADQAAAAYVFRSGLAAQFAGKLQAMLDFLLPLYHQEGKARLTLAIGCTGGRHRSVAMAQWLADNIDKPDYRINVRHRDIKLGI